MTAPVRAEDARPAAGPLGKLGLFAFRNRGRVVVAWLVGLVMVGGLSMAFGGEFADGNSAPGSDSERAQQLLEERFPTPGNATVDVVVQADGGVDEAAVRAEVDEFLAELQAMPHVAEVDDPYNTPGAVGPDGDILLSRVSLDVAIAEDMPVSDTQHMLEAAEAAERPGLDITLGGAAVQLAEGVEFGSEAVALLAAALILVVTFGSVVAAGLPLLVAISGLGVSALLTGLITAVIDVPSFATQLAAMIGIALGIDYTLLMVTRFREWRAAGLDAQTATVATLDTAGRAVMVAGGTVTLSMLGLFVTGLASLQGSAVITIAAVLIVILASVTLFPALLGYFGERIDRLRLPLGRRQQMHVADDGHVAPTRGWAWWSALVKRYRIPSAVLAVGILVAMAVPFTGARFGFPDAGNDSETRSSRQAYDAIADGFGPGYNGPLIVVAELPGASASAGLEQLAEATADVPGVAAVQPPQVTPAGDVAVMTVIPATGPQDADTEDLVHTLRDETIPAATAESGIEVHVGGVVAAGIDFNSLTAERLPYMIGGVVALSMLLLLLSFRSIVIPLTAALMNLLSVAAAFGVIALALQGGWFGGLFGIDNPTPMPAFIPVSVFAILFGLSMDYEVFLISRMREAWLRTKDNSQAIASGLAGTGRLITAAASIMVVVFVAFIPNDQVFIKAFGLGMATAILIDATIVRMLLVPAVMNLLGRSNWWLPESWERKLPRMHIEGRPDVFLASGESREEKVIPA